MSEYPSQPKLFGMGVLWTVGILAVIAVIGIGWWVFQAATAPVQGQVGVFVQNQAADNRVQAQSLLLNEYNDVKASRERIHSTEQILRSTTDPNQQATLQTNLLGQVNYCQSVVASYNADTQKLLIRDWKPIDLPDSLDSSTYCKMKVN